MNSQCETMQDEWHLRHLALAFSAPLTDEYISGFRSPKAQAALTNCEMQSHVAATYKVY